MNEPLNLNGENLMTETEQLVAAVVAEVIDEACDLTTLGDCSPEEFENRTIRLGGEKLVNIRYADAPQLLLLAEQLTAAGLPIPALLQDKLAAAAEQLQVEAAAHDAHAYALLGYLNARRQAA